MVYLMEKLKTAVVGVGYLGSFHAEKYARSERAELIAVVDVDEKRVEKCAKKLKAQALTDYRRLPALGVQCASVASDTSTHFEVASYLLAHGIDVLVEKPLCVDSLQGKELIAIARQHNRILQVGHLERFNPAFSALKGILTAPRFFEARRISPFVGRSHAVDVVRDLMIHDIDIIAHLVGRPLMHVEAVGIPVLTGTIDIANARLTFEGGAVANVSASRAAFTGERTIRMFQPELYISLDLGNKNLKIYKKGTGTDLLGFPRIEKTETKIEERDALADEISAFLDCVTSRTVPIVTGEDGLRALELAERIHEAIHQSTERVLADEEFRRFQNGPICHAG